MNDRGFRESNRTEKEGMRVCATIQRRQRRERQCCCDNREREGALSSSLTAVSPPNVPWLQYDSDLIITAADESIWSNQQ